MSVFVSQPLQCRIFRCVLLLTFQDALLVVDNWPHMWSGTALCCARPHFLFLMIRGPPLLRSNRFPGFQKKRRFCPMRQFYIRVPWTYPAKAMHQRSSQTRSSRIINGHICAKHPNNFAALLQCAEKRPLAKKLFLFGSAASGLTVRLPNMDQLTGGGLK